MSHSNQAGDRFNICPLAIVGIGTCLPGAPDPESYWRLLASGQHAITRLPESRLDRELYYQPGPPTPGKTYTEIGGAVSDDNLMSAIPGLDPAHQVLADPAHLLFLRTVLAALQDAGIDSSTLLGRRIGVFVGHVLGSLLSADLCYAATVPSLTGSLTDIPSFAALDARVRKAAVQRLITKVQEPFLCWSDVLPRTEPNTAAGSVSHFLSLTGPYMSVDGACASSLAALDLAARAIHAGEIEAAIVGGCCYNQWSSLVLFSQVQAVSANASRPFDGRGDGFVGSDGHVAIIIEPMDRALELGHPVRALIRGIGSSCDGKGKSLWAPLAEGQVLAIRRAYRGDVSPESVQVIEAHATGTQLGDAIEILALSEIFRNGNRPKIPITAVKGNIGHTRETAGLAGVVKMVLSMERGFVCPTAGYDPLIPTRAIDWEKTPFRVVHELEPWPDIGDRSRRCAVDSFGIGGINHHVILESFSRRTASGIGDKAASSGRQRQASVASCTQVLNNSDKVAIVGVGLVLPGMFDFAAFKARLTETVPFHDPPPSRWDFGVAGYPDSLWGRLSTTRGNFLKGWSFDWSKYRVPPREVENSDPLRLMLVEAVNQALEQAGYGQGSVPARERTAVYVGTIFGNDFTSRLNVGLRLNAFERDLLRALCESGVSELRAKRIAAESRLKLLEQYPIQDSSGSYSASTLASRISKQFDFQGPCCAIDAEEAGGVAALQAATYALLHEDCDLALCCAGQRTMHPLCFKNYELLGWLAREDHPGFLLVEGAVAFALRRLSDTRRSGEHVLAVLEEIHSASSREGPWSALQAAVQRVKEARPDLTPPAILECFGAGTPADEAEERRVVQEVVGASTTRTSATERIGMAQGASGLIGLANVLAYAQELNDTRPVTAAVNSVGLHGLAYHVRLQVTPPHQESLASIEFVSRTEQPRIFYLGAGNYPALLKQIESLPSDPDAIWAASAVGFEPHHDWRLAAVAASPQSLQAKLDLVRKVGQDFSPLASLHEQGIFLHRQPKKPPQLAFVFPGQGSQYAGMLSGLVREYPDAQIALRSINKALSEAGEAEFEQICWGREARERLGSDTGSTQISILAADLVIFGVLYDCLGLRPQVLVGHSFGELPALAASGAISVESAIRATQARYRALEALGEIRGRLINTSAGLSQIEQVKRRFPGGYMEPACFNSPEQTVLAISANLLEEVMAALEGIGEVAQLLPVPQPFHSALLADAQPLFRKNLAELVIRPPQIPLLSNVNNRYVAEPEEIRQLLVDQLTAPLRFTELIQRLWRDGVEIFVEVGPKSVVTRLIRAVLRDKPVLAIAADHPKVPAAEQMLRVKALLETQDLWPSQSQRSPAAALVLRSVGSGEIVPYANSRTTPPPVVAGLKHFDATQRRKKKLATLKRDAGEGQTKVERASAAPEHLKDVEQFLVKFVCEETGYPPEVVGLDQDLEAELGLDSIKKAQLLGELQDRFHIQLPASRLQTLSLSQVSTLRDIVRLLQQCTLDRPTIPTASDSRQPGSEVPIGMSESMQSSVRLSQITTVPKLDCERPGKPMKRWILRTESVPPLPSSPVRSLPTAIIGEGKLAQAFSDRLREQGSEIQMMDLEAISLAKARKAIVSARRVILIGSSHASDKLLDVDAAVRQRTLEQYALNILLILQSWVRKLHHSPDISAAELLAITQMGGDFGISPSREIHPLGGAITGLLRSLRREIPSLKMKVLDIDSQAPPVAIVDHALSERARGDAGLEAGHACGRRVLARIIPRPLSDIATPPSWLSLCGESAWVVTGGARGITALCARELGRRFHMHLHLIGTTRYRGISGEWVQRYSSDKYGLRSEILADAAKRVRHPLAIWERAEKEIRLHQTLREHADAGVRFTYHRVDVRNAAALAQVLTKIRDAGLPIRGILHGSGVEKASTFPRKSRRGIRDTFFVKVLGLQHLMALTLSDPIEVVIGFGSISGRFGGPGQTDYASASELLAKLLSAHRRKTGVRGTTFHWPAWAEVGMAVRPETRFVLGRAGQKLMPTREGISHFIREIEAGLPEAEVVIVDDPTFLDLDRTAVPAARGDLIVSATTASAEQPLLECSLDSGGNGERIFEVRFDPLRDPFLVDHQHEGNPLLPAAIGLEALSEAALCDRPAAVSFTIEQPKIHSALRFYRSGEIWTRVLAEAQDGCCHTELRGEFITRKLRLGEADRCFLSAKVRLGVLGEPPLAPARPPQNVTFSEVVYPDSVDRANPLRVYHGPTLQALKRVYSDGITTWGFLMAPNPQSLRPQRRETPWRLPAALLDGCLLACGSFAYQYESVYSLPSQFERLVMLRHPEPGSVCLVELRFLRRDAASLYFDFILSDSSGRPVLWAIDLRMIIVGFEGKRERPRN